ISTAESNRRRDLVLGYFSSAIVLTFFSISSLIFRTSSIDLPFGSSKFHSTSFFCMAASMGLGQASSTEQPIVTTSPARSVISAVSIFGDFLVRFIPRSLISSTTTGLTRLEGTVPALEAFNPNFLANAWAIWLRPAFSTQTNRISPLSEILSTLDAKSRVSLARQINLVTIGHTLDEPWNRRQLTGNGQRSNEEDPVQDHPP